MGAGMVLAMGMQWKWDIWQEEDSLLLHQRFFGKAKFLTYLW